MKKSIALFVFVGAGVATMAQNVAEIIVNDKMGEKIFSVAGLDLYKIRTDLAEENLDNELDFSNVKS